MPDISNLLAFILAALTGILSGFGIGGGTLLILILLLFFSAKQSTAQTINLLYFIPTAAASLYFHGCGGRLDKKAVVWTGGAGVIFAALASYTAPYIDTGLIRTAFGLVLLYVGFRELFCKAQRPAKSK